MRKSASSSACLFWMPCLSIAERVMLIIHRLLLPFAKNLSWVTFTGVLFKHYFTARYGIFLVIGEDMDLIVILNGLGSTTRNVFIKQIGRGEEVFMRYPQHPWTVESWRFSHLHLFPLGLRVYKLWCNLSALFWNPFHRGKINCNIFISAEKCSL